MLSNEIWLSRMEYLEFEKYYSCTFDASLLCSMSSNFKSNFPCNMHAYSARQMHKWKSILNSYGKRSFKLNTEREREACRVIASVVFGEWKMCTTQRDFVSPALHFLLCFACAIVYRFELYATFQTEHNYFDATFSQPKLSFWSKHFCSLEHFLILAFIWHTRLLLLTAWPYTFLLFFFIRLRCNFIC